MLLTIAEEVYVNWERSYHTRLNEKSSLKKSKTNKRKNKQTNIVRQISILPSS